MTWKILIQWFHLRICLDLHNSNVYLTCPDLYFVAVGEILSPDESNINILISLRIWRQIKAFSPLYPDLPLPYLQICESESVSLSVLFHSLWPSDCSLSSFVPEIPQARILKWVTILFSRGSSWPRNWTCVFLVVGRSFTTWDTRQVHSYLLK